MFSHPGPIVHICLLKSSMPFHLGHESRPAPSPRTSQVPPEAGPWCPGSVALLCPSLSLSFPGGALPSSSVVKSVHSKESYLSLNLPSEVRREALESEEEREEAEPRPGDPGA